MASGNWTSASSPRPVRRYPVGPVKTLLAYTHRSAWFRWLDGPMCLTHELALLPRLGVADLRCRYAQLFGEPSRTGNKTWLVKRLAWRLQALAEGDLSERARQRAAELAN